MAWPRLKSTPVHLSVGSRYRYDGTLAGSVYTKDRSGWMYFPSLPFDRKIAFLKADRYFGLLKPTIQERVSSLSDRKLRHVAELWLAFEDVLLFSNPSLDGVRPSAFCISLWKWVISTYVFNPHQPVLVWKRMTKRVFWLVNRDNAKNAEEPLPRELPDTLGGKCFGPSWIQTFPFLQKIVFGLPLTKVELTFFSHFTQTRGLNAPELSRNYVLSEFQDYAQSLSRSLVPDPQLEDRVRSISRRLARKYQLGRLSSHSHMSLRETGCLEASRDEGGTVRAACAEHCARYVRTKSDVAVTGVKTHFQAPYELRVGVAPFRTMCRTDPLEKEYDFLEMDFPHGRNTTVDTWDGGPKDCWGDPRFGFDGAFGYQLQQLALEKLIREDYVLGPPFQNGKRGLRVNPNKPIPVKAVILAEGGCKNRWVTVPPWAVKIVLQPLTHDLIARMRILPQSRDGLQAGHMAWQFAKALQKFVVDETDANFERDFHLGELECVSYDLKKATNFADQAFVKQALLGLLEECGILTAYNRFLVDLLCSPRIVSYTCKDPEDGLSETRSFTTKSGILMGDALTKPALTWLMQIAREIALENCVARGQTVRRFGRAAGDDGAEIGSPHYLEELKSVHESLNHVMGDFMYVHDILPYCEDLMSLRNPWSSANGIAFHKRPYEETILVDSLKLRVLANINYKQGSMLDKSPLQGQSNMFVKKLDWLPQAIVPHKRAWINRFLTRKSHLLDEVEYQILPPSLGGLGIPHNCRPETVLRLIESRHPMYLKLFTRACQDQGITTQWYIRKMYGLRFGNPTIMPTVVHEKEMKAYEYISFLVDLGRTKSPLLIKTELTTLLMDRGEDPGPLRYMETKKLAESLLNFVTVDDLLDDLEKNLLLLREYQIAAGVRPPEDSVYDRSQRRAFESINTLTPFLEGISDRIVRLMKGRWIRVYQADRSADYPFISQPLVDRNQIPTIERPLDTLMPFPN